MSASAASRPILARSHRLVAEVAGSLIFSRAGSGTNGALQAKGSLVSRPVGRTEKTPPPPTSARSTVHGGKSPPSSDPRRCSSRSSSMDSSGNGSSLERMSRSSPRPSTSGDSHWLPSIGPGRTSDQASAWSPIWRRRIERKNRREIGFADQCVRLRSRSSRLLTSLLRTLTRVQPLVSATGSVQTGSKNRDRLKATASVGVIRHTGSPRLNVLLKPIPRNPIVCSARLFE